LAYCIGFGTRDVLEVCQTIKLTSAELYHYFAVLFKDDKHSFQFWLNTAMNEENQGRLCGLLIKLCRKNNFGTIQVELQEAEITLFYIQSLIGRAKKNPPSLKEALHLAIDLETKMEAFRTENIFIFSDQSIENSFLAIANIDTKRLELLHQAYDRA